MNHVQLVCCAPVAQTHTHTVSEQYYAVICRPKQRKDSTRHSYVVYTNSSQQYSVLYTVQYCMLSHIAVNLSGRQLANSARLM